MQPNSIMPKTKDEFWRVYWFSPLQMITLVNPKPYDFPFMFELRNFVIKAGANERLPGTVANLYLSQMTRIMAQDDGKMEHLSDFALMENYYKTLIVDVENMVKDIDNTPAYLKDMPEHMAVTPDETPPWQQPVAEPVVSAIPETNSDMKNTVPSKNEKVVAPKEKTTKGFTYDGKNYSMTVDVDGSKSFTKDSTTIDEATYSKAASML